MVGMLLTPPDARCVAASGEQVLLHAGALAARRGSGGIDETIGCKGSGW